MGKITRRDFMQKSTAAAAGCALVTGQSAGAVQDNEKPKIKRYKPFGKTGFKVGDISSGAGQRDPGLVNHIFECGVNLIDTAFAYPGHEETIGKVLKKWRKKVFIISKWNPELVNEKTTKEELMKALDVSLDRLKTNYIDCMMIHAIGRPELGGMERIQNPAIYEAYDEAKKLGKIKFTGASSCGVNMLKEMEWGVDNDRFDVIICGSNFVTHGVEPILKKARAKGIATVAMKSMTVFKSELNIEELIDQSTNARQAVLKYMLAADLFDTVIISMRNYAQVKEYLAVSGHTKLSSNEMSMLNIMKNAISREYCRPGCSDCHGTCPANVPIADILRFKMYFENYGDEKRAMAEYRKLPETRNAQICADCSAPCEGNCRYEIPIKDKLTDAHSMLTLA